MIRRAEGELVEARRGAATVDRLQRAMMSRMDDMMSSMMGGSMMGGSLLGGSMFGRCALYAMLYPIHLAGNINPTLAILTCIQQYI